VNATLARQTVATSSVLNRQWRDIAAGRGLGGSQEPAVKQGIALERNREVDRPALESWPLFCDVAVRAMRKKPAARRVAEKCRHGC